METPVGEATVAVAGLRAEDEAVGSLAALCSYPVTPNTAVELSRSRSVRSSSSLSRIQFAGPDGAGKDWPLGCWRRLQWPVVAYSGFPYPPPGPTLVPK